MKEVCGEQGCRHQVLFWRDGFIGTQTHVPQKFSFSSDFGHYFENVGKCKIAQESGKKILKYPFLVIIK